MRQFIIISGESINIFSKCKCCTFENNILPMKRKHTAPFFLFLVACLVTMNVSAQYKSYKISVKGDTINAINAKGLKAGKWVNRIEELRGEPGYEEEGTYKDGAKDGTWRLYTLEGDLLGIENYKNG